MPHVEQWCVLYGLYDLQYMHLTLHCGSTQYFFSFSIVPGSANIRMISPQIHIKNEKEETPKRTKTRKTWWEITKFKKQCLKHSIANNIVKITRKIGGRNLNCLGIFIRFFFWLCGGRYCFFFNFFQWYELTSSFYWKS